MEEETQPPAASTQPPLKPHRGNLVLVLGLIAVSLALPGLLLCGIGTVIACICGVIAWVMGHKDMKEMDAGRMDPAARGLTKAGKICGMIGAIISIAGTVFWLIFMGVLALTGIQA